MKDLKETKNKLCKNVFKNGKVKPEREEYMKKWIEIINALERRKL